MVKFFELVVASNRCLLLLLGLLFGGGQALDLLLKSFISVSKFFSVVDRHRFVHKVDSLGIHACKVSVL